MINRLVAYFSFAVLAGFLGILLWFVPRIDIGVVIALTLVLAFADIYQNAGERDK